jgi:hypothetical protein
MQAAQPGRAGAPSWLVVLAGREAPPPYLEVFCTQHEAHAACGWRPDARLSHRSTGRHSSTGRLPARERLQSCGGAPAVSENTGVVMRSFTRSWLSPKMKRASTLKAWLPGPAGLTATCGSPHTTPGCVDPTHVCGPQRSCSPHGMCAATPAPQVLACRRSWHADGAAVETGSGA